MGRALTGGILREGILQPEDVVCYDRFERSLDEVVEKFSVSRAKSAAELVDRCDILLLAVKPQNLSDLSKEISGRVGNRLVISILAGKKVAEIRAALGGEGRVVRAMPNTPCLVGKGVTGLFASDGVKEEERDFVLSLFRALGKAEFFDKEELLDVVTGFTGSGPAFVFLMIEALADGAVRCGMQRDVASEFAVALVEGAAALLMETGTHPALAKEMVMSPGGTTAEGVAVLEGAGFRSAVIEAVMAAFERSREL